LGLHTVRSAGWGVDSIGGLTLGADPIAYAISYAAALDQPVSGLVALRAFTVRKEAKSHGTGKLVEGPFRRGDRVCVIEDTITTGGSALRAVSALREAGGVVAGVLALVDREEGGREAIEESGIPVISLARISELLPLAPTA
jgi:orotate phosphoribosyltransferase